MEASPSSQNEGLCLDLDFTSQHCWIPPTSHLKTPGWYWGKLKNLCTACELLLTVFGCKVFTYRNFSPFKWDFFNCAMCKATMKDSMVAIFIVFIKLLLTELSRCCFYFCSFLSKSFEFLKKVDNFSYPNGISVCF